MTSRREQLFSAKTTSPGSKVIPATVRFRHNKKKGTIDPQPPNEKMLCALRKVLATMSDGSGRWCIMGNKVQLISPPRTTEGKAGGPQSYHATGRVRVALMRGNDMVSKYLQFELSFRDTLDERGLPDVQFFEPTTVDEIPRSSAVDRTALA